MHQTKLRIHFGALLMELVGTGFLLLDILRLNARNPSEGIMLGDSLKYQQWYYHCGPLGFGFVFVGILLGGVCLLMEHKAMIAAQAATKPIAAP